MKVQRDWSKTRKPPAPAAQFSEMEDNTLRHAYGTKVHPIKYLRKFSSLAKFTEAQLKYRATTIGITRKGHRRPFCEREIQLMEKAIGEKSVPEMIDMLHRAGFKYRTAKHVRSYIYRNGGGSVRSDRFSSRELCSFFRCTSSQLRKWEKENILVPSGKYDNDTKFFYKPLEVARFVRHHSFELENYRVDIPWLISLLEEFWVRIKDLPDKKKGKGNGNGIEEEGPLFY
jgi:hypothetical protein